jgi:Transglutaminase-like superfamily
MNGYARGHVLEAAGGLLMTHAGLRVAGFRLWKSAIEWLTPGMAASGSAATQPEIELARAIGRWQAAAARHLPLKTNCLERSLTLWWQLRRRGIAANLRIGGRKEDGRFEAHAWVEVGGVVLDDSSGGFEPFDRHPASMEAQVR